MGKPNKIDNVNHPAHYAEAPFVYRKPECIDITKWLPFTIGCACKYIWRASLKGDDFNEDLDKALWYLRAYRPAFDLAPLRPLLELMEVAPDAPDKESAELKLSIIRDICYSNYTEHKIERLREALSKASPSRNKKK